MGETTQILFAPLEDEGTIEQRRGDRIGWEVSQALVGEKRDRDDSAAFLLCFRVRYG
jgi:hypothetical protein